MNIKGIFGKKLVKNAQAVSPIIATLMLVLVAVGSAGAFYVWQSGWQGGIEDKVAGSGELQASLTIGGSSTVYEFSAIAAEYYHIANPNYRVSYQKGGSGAGVASVGLGAVDIGSASRFVKDTENAKYPDLNKDTVKDFGRELVEHVVAWDAVVILCKGTVSGGTAGTAATGTFETALVLTADDVGIAGNSINFEWNPIPMMGTLTVTVTGNAIHVSGDTDGALGTQATEAELAAAIMANADANALVDATGGATVMGAAFPATALAGGIEHSADYFDFTDGVDATELINAINDGTVDWYDRSDESGTEEVFCNKLLGFKEDTVEEAVTAGKINNNADEHFPSNQDILAAFNAHTGNVWTFTSYGMATAGGYDMCNYADTTPDKDSIKDQSYAGIRPIVYITVGDPTGDIAQYIDFCMMPENNQNICGLADYVSIY